jgi:hypothetical protein
MINPNSRERARLLDEVDKRLGYVGYVEFSFHVPAPARADEEQLTRWRLLPSSEKIRVAEQYDKLYENLKDQVFTEWGRQQRVKAGIRSGSLLIALVAVLLFCLALHETLPVSATTSSGFLPMWWIAALAVMTGLYAVICKLGEYWFDLDGRHNSGLWS